VAEYQIAAAGYPLQVWYPDGELAFEGEQDGYPVVQVAWSPNGEFLAVAPQALPVRLLDANTGKSFPRDSYFTRTVNGLTWSPDSQRLLLGSGFGKTSMILVWDIASQNKPIEVKGQIEEVTGVSWSPNGQWWALGDVAGSVQIWDADTGKTLRVLEGHTGSITSLAWSPDNTRLVSSSEDGTVRVWGVKP
jgi:WD40 repeat protein